MPDTPHFFKSTEGIAIDLDGTIWNGKKLNEGASELLDAIRKKGKRLVFLTNASREGRIDVHRKIHSLGLKAFPEEVVTSLDLLGEMLSDRFGNALTLVVGTSEMRQTLAQSGHTILDKGDWERAQAVAVGNFPGFDYDWLRSAAWAIDRGAVFYAANCDARLPLENGNFDPGCGALVEAIAFSCNRRPIVSGKPGMPMFLACLNRLQCQASKAVVIGDNLATDIAGGKMAGMRTVWLQSNQNLTNQFEPDMTIQSLKELTEILES